VTSRRAKILLKLGLTVVVLVATLWIVGVDRIADAIRRLDFTTWILVALCFFPVHGAGTLKWRFFVGLCGARLQVRDAFRCYAAGLFANLCLPTMIGGDVLRAGLAMAAARQKTAVVLGSLVDRGSDLLALGILALTGFLLAWHPASEHHPGEGGTNWTPFIVGLGLAAAAAVAAVIAWRRWRPRGRAHKILLEMLVALRRLKSRFGLALVGLCGSTAVQFCLLLMHRQLGTQMGMRSELEIWLFIYPIAKLIAMLPISFGGLGVREAAFAGLAELFGMSKPLAVASSLAWQAVMLFGGLCGGAVWMLLTWRPPVGIGRAEGRPT
jgi:uncharacterized membrane protein YbhN (UPF0104 family)